MNKNRIIENKNKESFVKKWGVVFVLSLALAIILIDSTVLNVSISVLIKELNTDIQGIQWIITLYSLVLASLTITGGRLGDLFGRKKMFVFGAIIFALGSLIAALSNSLGMLAFGWSVVEGIGAALMMPATASLLVSKFKGKDRNIAFGIWGGVAAASTAIGPLLGGYLTTNFSWRWAFAINIFVVLLVVIGSIYVSEYKDDNEKPTLDIFGVILSSLGLLSVVFGIIQSTDYGWIKAKQMFNAFGVNWDFSGYSISIVSIIIGLILLLIFMYWEARIESKGKTPLVSLKIFTNKQFNAGLATSMVMSLGQAGLIFSIPVFIQAVLGKDAFHTGLAMLPLSIAAFICAPLGGFLSHKIPPKYLVQFGLFLNFIGYLVLRSSFSTSATTSDLILGLIILGSGMGFIMAQIGNITMSAVSSKQAGEASGVSNTVRQLGSTLGTAVIGALLLTTLTNSMVDKVNASEVFPEQFKERIVSEVSKSGDSLEFESSPNINYGFPEKMPDIAKDLVKNEMKSIVSEATVDGNKIALWYAAWIAFIGVIVASWLPKGTNIERNDDISVKNK